MRLKNVFPALVLYFVASGLAVSSASASDWPLWRNANGDGYAADQGLPESWSQDGENLLWKYDVGGRSTPIVLDGRVCVITLAEPDNPSHWQERVVCFEEDTGKIAWDFRYKVFITDIPHHRVGWASLAGDTETGYIYSNGVEGMVYCLDKDGKVVWKRSFAEEVGRISGYGGRTAAPIVDGDLMIVGFLSAGWGDTAIPRTRYYGLNKATGETVWVSTPGGRPFDTVYCVPVVREINGERLLIDGNGDGQVHAIHVATGKPAWSYPLSKRGLNSSVTVSGDGVVYASHSEDNVDGSTAMGRVIALDATKVSEGKPELLWMADGFTAGYSSPALHDGILYQVDNSANLGAFDAKSGEELWRYNIGTMQRASPVIADGKIFVSDVDGQFHILKMNGRSEPEPLDVEVFKNEDSSATTINGSPAIANGKVFLLTRNTLYAISDKSAKPSATKPMLGEVAKAPAGAEIDHIIIVPGETVMAPGETKEFKVHTYDAKGRLIGGKMPSWEMENLKGSRNGGNFTAASTNVPQGGYLVAKVGPLEAKARVSVRPRIPFREDFGAYAVDSVPPGWNAAGGRFKMVELDGEKMLSKPPLNPVSYRTTVYVGHPDEKAYEIAVDAMYKERRRALPDVGLVSHRYILDLRGNRGELQIRSWLSELKAFSKTIKFRSDPDTWYRIKMRVDVGEEGSGWIRGKVWKRDEAEPAEWTIEVEDPLPHRHGAPGIYGYSNADIYYDNLEVTKLGDS